MSLLRFTGALAALPEGDRRRLLERTVPAADPALATGVAAIVADVRARGDQALKEQSARFDGGAPESIEVPRATLQRALDELDPSVRRAMERAVRNVAAAHAAQRPRAVEIETEPGVRVGRRPDPLARVGVYAPGGRAAYPSSVIMGVVPALVAGVREVVLCSPPQAGLPSRVVMAAAALAGVHRVFAAGGAGAVAAMAYGTEIIPAVDRIVGPGNAWVAEAKRQVLGPVAIDAPAGPSELVAVADASASADAIAREMIAQAEHDPDAASVALVEGEGLAARVAAALAPLVVASGRREVVEESLATGGALLHVPSLVLAWPFVEAYAPEHLLLATRDPRADMGRVHTAGAIFLGERSSVAFGDYLAGANHVLPTAGTGRAWSGLSLLDYYRWTSFVETTPEGAASLAGDTARFAAAEGLPGHAAAAAAWGRP